MRQDDTSDAPPPPHAFTAKPLGRAAERGLLKILCRRKAAFRISSVRSEATNRPKSAEGRPDRRSRMTCGLGCKGFFYYNRLEKISTYSLTL